MFRTLQFVVAWVAGGIILSIHASGPYSMPWSTDVDWRQYYSYGPQFGQYGPDGPWQAIAVFLDGTANGTGTNVASVWPTWSFVTTLPTVDAGGNYSAWNTTSNFSTLGLETDSSFVKTFQSNFSESGFYTFDKITFLGDATFSANATIAALDVWDILLPDGRNYTPPVGILGLGPAPTTPSQNLDYLSHPSILEQMKSADVIPSAFFSLHMGSVSLGQSGSMVLGGYDQSRVLGDVGTFQLYTPNSLPSAYLLDVTLGVETGGSPFNQSDTISLWHLVNDQAGLAYAVQEGGQSGSVIVIPDPGLPYLYMPLGICETAAQYLPVTWNAALGLYLWNSQDAQFSRIITSPAYMGFVFEDATTKNITIKVPFQLLNLTLTAPLVETPTPYFPCVPFNGNETLLWALGRAFLQAAFLAINLEQNVTYMAQAPGPNMVQSLINTVSPTGGSIASYSIDTFATSWADLWVVLPTSESSSEGLSRGALAGVIVGSVLGALAIAAVGFLAWTRRKKAGKVSDAPKGGSDTAPHEGQPKEDMPAEVYGNALPHEMVARESVVRPVEIDGHALPYEMMGTDSEHAAPQTYYELPHER